MDDATKKIALSLISGILRKVALLAAGSLATHGVAVSGNFTEIFVSLGVAAVVGGYSLWKDYGRAIVLTQLQVWKAKALAQQDAMRRANVPQPTHAEIADKIPDPTVTATTVAKVMTAGCLALILLAGLAPAMAQPREDAQARSGAIKPGFKLPIDPLGLNNRVGTGSPLNDLLGALDAKLLPDLQYALKLAEASNSRVTAPCYKAWIDIINTRQKAVENDGQAVPLPDPHLVTDFEKLVELRNSLQPDSPFMIACSPVASMVRKDILGFIGTVITGGAGLATLVPGL